MIVETIVLPPALVVVMSNADEDPTVDETLDDEITVLEAEPVWECRTLPVLLKPLVGGIEDTDPVELEEPDDESIPFDDETRTDVDIRVLLAEREALFSERDADEAPNAVEVPDTVGMLEEETVTDTNVLVKVDGAEDGLQVLMMMQEVVVEIMTGGAVLLAWPPHSLR